MFRQAVRLGAAGENDEDQEVVPEATGGHRAKTARLGQTREGHQQVGDQAEQRTHRRRTLTVCQRFTRLHFNRAFRQNQQFATHTCDRRALSVGPASERCQSSGDDSCMSLCPSWHPTRTRITASPDLDGCRRGIEVGLEHRQLLYHVSALWALRSAGQIRIFQLALRVAILGHHV